MSSTSEVTLKLCKEFENKSLIEMMLHINKVYKLSAVETKKITLSEINELLGTDYNINHFNNWLAGRKPAPEKVKSIIRRSLFQYIFGDDTAEILSSAT